MIISSCQAHQLLEAMKNGLKSAEISLDLNITKTKVEIEENSFIFGKNEKIFENQLNKAIKDYKSCFLINENSLIKIQLFSKDTNKFYKLVPTNDAPTIEISGIKMHATKGTTPIEDASKKIEIISPIKGVLLDTCMGLGYTAILASKPADFVFTCEKDENVLEIAKFNPCSKELFNNKKISILKADIFEKIKSFKSAMFNAVIHDPPRFILAPELYSLEFYKQILRVLKKDGKLYHYTGSPGSRFRKINLAKNVAKKLSAAGFKDIENAYYGLTAKK